MPRIQEYNPTVVPDTNIDTKQASGVSFGKGLNELGTGIQELGQGIQTFQQRQQTTAANVDISKNALDLETQIKNQQTPFDPTDPDARTNFFQGFDTANQKVLAGITDPKAQEYAQELIDRHVANYWNMALTKNAQLQGKEMTDQIGTKMDIATQSVYQDPSQLQNQIEGLHQFYSQLPHGEDATEAATQLKQKSISDLTATAAKGQIMQNPYQALQDIKSAKYDLPGEKLEQLQSMAESQIRAKKSQDALDENRVIHQQVQTQQENHKQMLSGIFQGTVSPTDATNAFMQGHINETQLRTQQDLFDNMAQGAQKGDPAVIRQVMKNFQLPDGDPNKITDFQTLTSRYAVAKGKGIDQKSLQNMADAFLSSQTPAADQAALHQVSDDMAKKLIQPSSIPWGDREGLGNWAQALNAVHDQYKKNVQAGIPLSDMVDKSSKNYLGLVANNFQRSQSQVTQQQIYNVHGAGAYNPNVGQIPQQPVGTDPNKTPIPQQNTTPVSTSPAKSPALTPDKQAIVQGILEGLKRKNGS